MTVEEFISSDIPRPFSRLEDCIVPACTNEKASAQSALCAAHRARYGAAKKRALLPFDASERTFASGATPLNSRGSFSLINLVEPLRSELLFAMQTDDRAGYMVDPVRMRHLAQALKWETTLTDPQILSSLREGLPTINHALLQRFVSYTSRAYQGALGVDLTQGDIWDNSLLLEPLPTKGKKAVIAIGHGRPDRRVLLDFRTIHVQWLRDLVKQWAREFRPEVTAVRKAIKAFSFVSDGMSVRPDRHDPKTAHFRDLQRGIDLLSRSKNKRGASYTPGSIASFGSAIRICLSDLRSKDALDDLPLSFSAPPAFKLPIKKLSSDDRDPRAIPNRTLLAIMRALPHFADPRRHTGSLMSSETLGALYRTALRVLIDTGRRPGEVCALQVGCVIVHSEPRTGKETYELEYDNTKAGRLHRRLPIPTATAKAILEWEQYRKSLALPSAYDDWLFPSPSVGRRDAVACLATAALNLAVKRLVASVRQLESDVRDELNGGYLPMIESIVPYSFRHSYAQRHADMGVDKDVLKELMDHSSLDVTMIYYRVPDKKKQEAVELMSALSLNAHGEPQPMHSATGYQVASVAVAFGSCTEPTNVQAGGTSCPLRFRCISCKMFRADPSFLPAIEDHLAELRSDFAIAEVAGFAEPLALDHMRDEINEWAKLADKMRATLDGLSEDDQEAVADASTAVRRLRGSRPLLPLSVT